MAHHSDSKGGDATISVAGRNFTTRDELVVFCRNILRGNKKDYKLAAKEQEIMEGILKKHPNAEQKIGKGILCIKVGVNPKFPDTPSFVVVQTDGKEVDFSYLKIAGHLFPAAEKEHSNRKQFLPGIVAKVKPVDGSTPALQFQSWMEKLGGGKIRFRISLPPVIDKRDNYAHIVMYSSKELDDLIGANIEERPKFNDQSLQIMKLTGFDESEFWKKAAEKKEMKRLGIKPPRAGGRGRGGRGRGRGRAPPPPRQTFGGDWGSSSGSSSSSAAAGAGSTRANSSTGERDEQGSEKRSRRD